MFYVLSKTNCPWCDKAKEVLDSRGEPYEAFLYTEHPLMKKLMVKAGLTTVPQVWYEGEYIGGYEDLVKYLDK